RRPCVWRRPSFRCRPNWFRGSTRSKDMKENADKARALDAAELAKKLNESAEQSFPLRFQLAMGPTDGGKKNRQTRNEGARNLTVIRERELGKSEAPAQPVKKTAKAAKTAAKAPAAKAPAAAPAKKAAAKKAPVKKTAVSKGKS